MLHVHLSETPGIVIQNGGMVHEHDTLFERFRLNHVYIINIRGYFPLKRLPNKAMLVIRNNQYLYG
jgi:hypothetical protein